jgi:peroxiredoxin
MPLEPGDKAPDFTLLDQHGESFTLSKSLKTKKVRHLIYFFPGRTGTEAQLARARLLGLLAAGRCGCSRAAQMFAMV